MLTEIYSAAFWIPALGFLLAVYKWRTARNKEALAAVEQQRVADWARIEKWQLAESAKTDAWRREIEQLRREEHELNERRDREGRELSDKRHEENREDIHDFRDANGASMTHIAVLASRLDKHEKDCAEERTTIKGEMKDTHKKLDDIRDRLTRIER